jgi:eukaryotic-like serine/threonine-protein kinase
MDKIAFIIAVIYSSRMPRALSVTHFRFGPFELDAARGELRKNGVRVRLPNQPSQVLTTLLTANRIVTREELRQQIWSGNRFVDFDHGLNVAVNKLRQALSDTAENPRYIETLPGRGYRFIAPVEAVSSPEPADATRPRLPPALPLSRIWAGAVAFFLGAISGWLARPQRAPMALPVQFTVALPQGLFSEPAFNGQDFAISPDGRQLAFVASDPAKSGLWIRRLSSLDPARLAAEHNVRSVEWSSDGRSIYFGEMGILRRVSAAGGAAETVYELASGAGDWNSLIDFGKERILFTRLGKAFWAAPAGGTATMLKLDDGDHLWPRMLPGGYLLYVRFDQQIHRFRAWASNISEPKDRRALVQTDSRVLYAPPMPGRHESHLLYIRRGSLVAQAFDATALRLIGQPFPIAENVFWFGPAATAAVSVSANGVLVYRTLPSPSQLKWVDRAGRQIATVGQPAIFITQFCLSPDRMRLAASIYDHETGGPQLWSFDLATGSARRITRGPGISGGPVWSPDGKRVAVARADGATPKLSVRSVDENAPDELVAPAPFQAPTDWSPDGRFIAYQTSGSLGAPGADVFVADLAHGRRLVPLVGSPAQELGARFSPDGSWLAYLSDQSGRTEAYVQAFQATPAPALVGTPRQISTNGATILRWRSDGKELFYISADNWLMAVPMTGKSRREFATARRLFRLEMPPRNLTAAGIDPGFDVSADGQQFLIADPQPIRSAPFVVVQNWQGLLN